MERLLNLRRNKMINQVPPHNSEVIKFGILFVALVAVANVIGLCHVYGWENF